MQDINVERSSYEPKVPNLIANSFAVVRTVGMREAPETLVLELFRELFYEKFSEERTARQLDPANDSSLHESEKQILYLARGRAKRLKRNSAREYYSPAYPEQARAAWLRSNSERVVRYNLLLGPVIQYLRESKSERNDYASDVARALYGKSRGTEEDTKGAELLWATTVPAKLDPSTFGMKDLTTTIADLKAEFESIGDGVNVPNDPIASRIALDFRELCALEGAIPRLQWLDFLKCFLRLSCPIWLLSQMRITSMLRDWAFLALEGGVVQREIDVIEKLQARSQDLFRPTTTGSGEMVAHVEDYMKARVELSLLLNLLQQTGLGMSGLLGKQLIPAGISRGNAITVVDLLTEFKQASAKIKETFPEVPVRQLVLRNAEKFAAWTSPLRRGQGKNIDELLIVIRRSSASDDDDGYLATRSVQNQARVFPGPLMLKTIVLLASRAKVGANRPASQRGKFVLSDVERHFQEYGVNFSVSAGARPMLIQELSRMGLLKGSPDAGESAEIVPPLQA